MGKLEKRPDLYSNVKHGVLMLPDKIEVSEPGTVDMVLTFRNIHNWMAREQQHIAMKAFYEMLKPGGVLGVVEHRANPGTTMNEMKKSGYVTEEHAIEIAEKHGFTLVSKSEINANSKDSKDHPRGVWTLPPSLRLKEQDKQKYLNIGESDRMTLLFKKT